MAFNYSPKVSTNGLILYLDATNSRSYVSGSTTWNDLSRNQLTGNIINQTTFDPRNGGCFKFDAVDDYIDLTTTSVLRPPDQVSVSQWIYNIDYTGRKALISNNQAAGYSLYLWDNRFEAYFWINGNWRVPGISNIGYSGWINLVGTYDNRYARLYVNGILGSTIDMGANYPITYNPSVPLWIGLEPTAGGGIQGFGYDGYIANTLIYDRAITAEEVLQNYNATKTRFGL